MKELLCAVAVSLAVMGEACAQNPHHKAADEGLCVSGHEQSPIDMAGAQTASLPALRFDYRVAALSVAHLGHAVQATAKQKYLLYVDNVAYELVQLHSHHPSEHLIDGRAAALEVHLVHKDQQGSLAVVGILFNQGEPNEALGSVHASVGADTEIDVHALLPSSLDYFTYAGSLTTPPCSEGVKWIVLTTAETASAEQIEMLKKLHEPNARQPQKIGKRTIWRSGQ